MQILGQRLAKDMAKICSRYLQDRPKISPGYVQYKLMTCQKYDYDISASQGRGFGCPGLG